MADTTDLEEQKKLLLPILQVRAPRSSRQCRLWGHLLLAQQAHVCMQA